MTACSACIACALQAHCELACIARDVDRAAGGPCRARDPAHAQHAGVVVPQERKDAGGRPGEALRQQLQRTCRRTPRSTSELVTTPRLCNKPLHQRRCQPARRMDPKGFWQVPQAPARLMDGCCLPLYRFCGCARANAQSIKQTARRWLCPEVRCAARTPRCTRLLRRT